MVRAMRFYTLIPRFFADPRTHPATIRWGLPRTGRWKFLSVRKVRQKVLASAGGFWLDHVPLSFFHELPVLWRSRHHFPCPSILGTGTRHWCLAFWDVRHLCSDLLPAWFPFAFDPCQLRSESYFNVDLHAASCCELLHHVKQRLHSFWGLSKNWDVINETYLIKLIAVGGVLTAVFLVLANL